MYYSFEQFYRISDNIKKVLSSKDLEASTSDIFLKRIMKFISQISSDQEYIIEEKPTQKFKTDIEHICDFLNNISKQEQQKQLIGNYNQILSNANKWSIITQKQGAKIAQKTNIKGQELVYDFGNGFKLWHLTSREQCKIEGNKMGHCVGGYNPEKKIIYSLRDENNTPHVTMELNKKNQIKQIKGKQNAAPKQVYQEYIKEFLRKHLNYKIIGDGKNIGYVEYKDKYYDNKSNEWRQIVQEIIDSIKNQIKEKDGKFYIFDNVRLNSLGLTMLPKWLNEIHVIGDFYCNNNQLISLQGAPKSVGRDFYCNNNQLTSLQGAPKSVRKDFNCSNNQLTSLQGAPKSVIGNFGCSNNQLTSLQGAPESVRGDFYCNNNQLTSLQGAPRNVRGDFSCTFNQLISLQGAPKSVIGDFYCSFNQLISLQGAPENVEEGFYCNNNQLTSLQGAPKSVRKDFNCSDNQLISLQGAPKSVGRDFYCNNNQLTSLQGAPENIGGCIYCSFNQLTSLQGAPENARIYSI